MVVPLPLDTGLVTGTFLNGITGSSNGDPGATPIAGVTAIFTADLSPALVRNQVGDPVNVEVRPVNAITNSRGQLVAMGGDPVEEALPGVPLIASISDNIAPSGWTWTVTLNAPGLPVLSLTFTIEPDEQIDLARVISIPTNFGKELIAWKEAVHIVEEANASAQASATLASTEARNAASSAVSSSNAAAVSTAAKVDAVAASITAASNAATASTAATTAATQATAAAQRAAEAAASASGASTDRIAAATSASNAHTSETQAAAFRDTASSAQVAASAARDAAVSAKNDIVSAAQTASDKAQIAVQNAAIAVAQAQIALDKSQLASQQATASTQAATSAANDAQTASTKAQIASDRAVAAATSADAAAASAVASAASQSVAGTSADTASASATAADASRAAAQAILNSINTNRGTPNGYAILDGTGKLPSSMLPTSAMEYRGTWNAATNTPTLTDAAGNAGDFYTVSVAGVRNLGSGNIDFGVGDQLIHNGTRFEKIDNTDAVTSVAGKTGAVVVTKSDVGLGSVDNTPDADKPISTATQTALNDTVNDATIVGRDLVMQKVGGGTSNAGTLVPSITIGTVTTVESTNDADATISGVAPNQILNLSLPRGVAGPANLVVGTVNTLATGQQGLWVKTDADGNVLDLIVRTT